MVNNSTLFVGLDLGERPQLAARVGKGRHVDP